MLEQPPQFDNSGLNILDPADKLGHKSLYITKLQETVLMDLLPDSHTNTGQVLDLGCGWGRLTSVLTQRGWNAVGLDPDLRLIEYARKLNPSITYEIGALPDLPFAKSSFNIILLQNVLRPLLLSDHTLAAKAIPQYLEENGYLYVVENVKRRSDVHFNSDEIESFFVQQGMTLVKSVSFRASRNPLLLFIKYGLIPHRVYQKLANLEIHLMRKVKKDPLVQYYNKLFIFKKSG